MTRAIRRLIGAPEGIVFVAEDAFGPFAYVAGIGATRPNGSRALHPLRRIGSRRRFEKPPPGDHAELLSIGVADPFVDTGADKALAKAFLTSPAAVGRPVGAIVDSRDRRTIDVLESAGFHAVSSRNQPGRLTELWAQRS